MEHIYSNFIIDGSNRERGEKLLEIIDQIKKKICKVYDEEASIEMPVRG